MKRIFSYLLLAALPLGAAPPLRFEAVSIRPESEVNLRSLKPGEFSKMHGITVTGGRFEASYTSLLDLLLYAFREPYPQVQAPQWTSEEHFHVIATLPQGATEKDVPEMLTNMLKDRFHLSFREESRPTGALELTTEPYKPSNIERAVILAPEVPAAQPPSKKYRRDPVRVGAAYDITVTDTTVHLAEYLAQEVHMTVLDHTVGLSGIHVFQWMFYPFPRDVEGRIAPPQGDFLHTLASWHDEGLRKIGLRLKPTKTQRKNVIAEKLDKTPTEN